MKSFEGVQNPGDPLANATIRQDVPATAGVEYEMTVWFKQEAGNLTASTRIGIEFFTAAMTSLGTFTLELNGLHPQDSTWRPVTLTATAPAGTATARVFGEMLGGVESGVNPQSSMFDDFSLVDDQSTPVEATSWGRIKGEYR